MTDYFQRLGLPRRFDVDIAALEREYLARSRVVHPDFHMVGAAADLAASMDSAATLNEAYNSLRQPLPRAEHLLALEGGPAAAEQKAMPTAFLAEMLEAREAIEAARAAPNPEATAAELHRDFQERQDRLFLDIARQFATLQQLPIDDPARKMTLLEIRGMLNAVKFIQGLLRDLHAD